MTLTFVLDLMYFLLNHEPQIKRFHQLKLHIKKVVEKFIGLLAKKRKDLKMRTSIQFNEFF